MLGFSSILVIGGLLPKEERNHRRHGPGERAGLAGPGWQRLPKKGREGEESAPEAAQGWGRPKQVFTAYDKRDRGSVLLFQKASQIRLFPKTPFTETCKIT